ncbi:MAG TPA: ThiF family adenylyltransferase [Candidatus Limnocylindrales bacterium]|nr:ThiF family adenylyltransferase [Candidatus Limnocylindrales bacterium]
MARRSRPVTRDPAGQLRDLLGESLPPARLLSAGVLHLEPADREPFLAIRQIPRPGRAALPDRGQAVLRGQKVGIIDAGRAGSLVIEYLARLGVGTLVVIDPNGSRPATCRADRR